MIQARQFLVVNGSQNRAAFPAFCGAKAALPALSFNCQQASDSLSNLVGYNQVKVIGNKMNLLTVSFEAVGKDGKALLKDVMDTKPLTSSTDDGDNDYINSWNMTTGDWGDKYFYVNQPDWSYEDEDTHEWIDYTDTWVEANSYLPVNPEMVPGESFWLFHAGEDIEGLNFAGQVTAGAHGYTLTGGKMNLCGNPYPTTLDLRSSAKQVTITGLTSADDDSDNDYVNTWNLVAGDWGDKFFYVNQPDWSYEDEDTHEWIDYTDTWVEANSYLPQSTAIQPGAGFWFYATNPGVTLSFTELVK